MCIGTVSVRQLEHDKNIFENLPKTHWEVLAFDAINSKTKTINIKVTNQKKISYFNEFSVQVFNK